MIETTHLRIGNLVQDATDINSVLSVILVGGKHILGYASYYEENVSKEPHEIDGIPLTEEWLLKLGFTHYEPYFRIETLHGVLTQKPSKLVVRKTANGNYVVINPANRTIYLSHVHQLQNLYHSLTGTELKLK